jgi:putative nucleotidyltransferase with HDIG domain
VAAQLLRTLGDDSVHMQEIASLVASDATLCGRVLQHANSAEFAMLEPVRNVRQALTVLGLDRTRKVTVTIAAAVYSGASLRAAELRRCWRHSLATAVLSDELAKRCGVFVETAYTAGMMHDIGRLGLLVAYPREYEQTIRNAAERCLDLLDFEKDVFGIDHAEAGRWLAERWRLPEDYREIAGRHHDRCDGGPLTLLGIVHIACRLADYFGYDVTRPLVPQPLGAIVANLPHSVRDTVVRDREQLRAAVESAIFSHDQGESEPQPDDEVDATAGGVDGDDAIAELARLCVRPEAERVSTPSLLATMLAAIRRAFHAVTAK